MSPGYCAGIPVEGAVLVQQGQGDVGQRTLILGPEREEPFQGQPQAGPETVPDGHQLLEDAGATGDGQGAAAGCSLAPATPTP